MSVENHHVAQSFSVGGWLIMISFNLAMAATLYIVAEFPDYFVAFLVGAAFVWLTGFYNAFRALQEMHKKN